MSESGDVYLIWSHEHSAWWAAMGTGYTPRLSEAGRYSRESALHVCARAIPGTAAQMGGLPELPVRLIDAEEIQRRHHLAFGARVEAWE